MSAKEKGSAAEGGQQDLGWGQVTGRELRELVADDLWLDELIDRAAEVGVALTGPGGFLPEICRAAQSPFTHVKMRTSSVPPGFVAVCQVK